MKKLHKLPSKIIIAFVVSVAFISGCDSSKKLSSALKEEGIDASKDSRGVFGLVFNGVPPNKTKSISLINSLNKIENINDFYATCDVQMMDKTFLNELDIMPGVRRLAVSCKWEPRLFEDLTRVFSNAENVELLDIEQVKSDAPLFPKCEKMWLDGILDSGSVRKLGALEEMRDLQFYVDSNVTVNDFYPLLKLEHLERLSVSVFPNPTPEFKRSLTELFADKTVKVFVD